MREGVVPRDVSHREAEPGAWWPTVNAQPLLCPLCGMYADEYAHLCVHGGQRLTSGYLSICVCVMYT